MVKHSRLVEKEMLSNQTTWQLNCGTLCHRMLGCSQEFGKALFIWKGARLIGSAMNSSFHAWNSLNAGMPMICLLSSNM